MNTNLLLSSTLKSIISILGILFILISPTPVSGQTIIKNTKATAAQVVEKIIKNTGAAVIPNTVDIFKEGNPETTVTGIVTCMFATLEVLKQAVSKNCNLIITHEPIYYNHLDETKHLENNSVFLAKKRYINDHKLIIWRFHDYIHSMKPDGVLSGMTEKLGWKQYAVDDQLDRFIFPETTLKLFVENLKKTFPQNQFYIVGDPEMKFTKVYLSPGAPGGGFHIQLLEDKNVEVLITGESPQWETYEYTRDATSQGRKKAVIFLGHIPSEESGMAYCSEWLKTFIKDIPVYFISCGPSYWSN
jgi:putative NIF3 family GTP cyclohydrolase 1 type 2